MCGEYRIRTDDFLHAKQALWPAELIPQLPVVSHPHWNDFRERILKTVSVDKKQRQSDELILK